MQENEKKVAGYVFTDARDFKEAKREEETVEYIRANTDLNDLNKVLKLYHKLVDRRTFKTVVGYMFLKELKGKLISSGLVTEESLPGIRISPPEGLPKVYNNTLEKDQEKQHLAMLGDYRIKLKNSRIISAFLAVIIVIMIMIAVFSDRSMFSIYENKVIDRYQAWQMDLEARQQAVEEQEQALAERERALEKQE